MSEALEEVKQRALALLARREHGEKELRHKLLARDLDVDAVEQVLAQLKQEGLQSDYRYTEAFVHDRRNRGYGPLHILQELKQKGIDAAVYEEFVDARDAEWQQHLQEVHNKKFAGQGPRDYKEQASQSRFLQYRGFSSDQIQRFFRRLKDHDD